MRYLAETGKEGVESEEFIIDNSAPKLTVNYEGDFEYYG